MHGITAYIIIGGCIGIAVTGIFSFVRDMRKAKRAALERKKILARLRPK